MTSSLPTRNSMSPFRRSSSSLSMDTTNYKKKQHGSLKIVTTTTTITSSVVKDENNNNMMPSPSVRQRLSSLFRTSSPVVLNLKESFQNKRASLSSISFSPSSTPVTTVVEEEEVMEPLDDSHSTTTSISSDSVDHMPSSPADTKALASTWQPSVTMLSFEPTIKEDHQFAVTPSSTSLAYQVNQILGSTLDEVDEEIDRDWENSRNRLRQSLVPSPLNNRNQWL
ncbi:hypothetical protein BD770DRAFT_397633 [Pilaira anomala]|nr:hypothetical protein BD770DRAFT_397633 [Pilaira anomala]